MYKKSDVKVDGQLFIDEDSVIRCEDDKTEITESNLREFADMLQFDTLAQECILEDLCRSYNISREDMFVLIHELKKRGNNIVTLNTSASHDGDDLKTQVTLIRNFGHEELINDLSYNIIDNEENIKVMLISDTRFGSIYQQTTILNDMYLKAKEMGVKYVFLTGDVVEGIYRGAKSIYNTTLHKDGYDDQADYVAACFPRIKGITTYFVTGEHDLSFLKGTDKVDIGKLIAAKRDDMIYLGPKRKKVSFVTGDRRSGSISFYLQHSSGNVPYTISYKPQQKISSLRNEDKTDILVTSHFAACDSFLRRGVRSYQVPTVTATTDEMKDANTPVYNTIGAWVVSLDRDKKGSLKRTSQMYIPYYKTIKDDYRTFKKLEVSDHILVQVPEKSLKDDRDKMFSQIRNGESVDKICERLGVSPLKFGGIVEELRHRGYDISIDESSENKVVIKKNKGKTNMTIKPNIDELKKIRQVWISDTHLCNEAQQLNLINKIYREAAERGIDTVLHFGDVLDGDYHNRPEHQYALFRLGATRQLEYLTNYYPKVEGIETYFITGTHDQTHCKNGGVFVGPAIEDKRPDMHFLGDDMGMYHPLDSKKTSIEMFHPGGGCSSSLSYKMQKYIDKMEPGTKPNIIGSGHFHQSHMMAYRNVIAFLIPCLTSKTNFAIRQGLENTMGAYFIDMYVNADGDIEMIEFEEKRFTEKDIKKDDYIKTRQLVLKKDN